MDSSMDAKVLDVNGRHRTGLNKKPASALGGKRVLVFQRTSLDIYLVVIGGLEPPTPAL